MPQETLEKHEYKNFGREVVHNHPYFIELQKNLECFVSDLVSEPIESAYNFLSLYNNLGKCDVHMDAPLAKWTLDLCIDQSTEWPIYFTKTQDWPVDFNFEGDYWGAGIKFMNEFEKVVLHPGEAAIFSGSSQWHYRDAIPEGKNQFCHLLFFHFIPKGTRKLSNPRTWNERYQIPSNIEFCPKSYRHFDGS